MFYPIQIMGTKYWWFFVFGGIYIALAIRGQIGNKQIQGRSEVFVNLTMLIFAVLSIGFGFKLRRLQKKGIEYTKSLKK